jgi:hypothetical protein
MPQQVCLVCVASEGILARVLLTFGWLASLLSWHACLRCLTVSMFLWGVLITSGHVRTWWWHPGGTLTKTLLGMLPSSVLTTATKECSCCQAVLRRGHL